MKHPLFRADAADLAMSAVVLMWATNNIVIKVTLDVLPPLAFVVIRFLIVIALVWAWIVVRRMPAGVAIRDLPLLALAGVSGFGLYNALFTIGMERTLAFSLALFVSMTPVFTLILAQLMGIERPTRAQWLAVALAAVGALVFVGDKVQREGFGGGTSGDFLGLLASMSFAVYSLAARPLTSRYGASVTTAWAILFGLAAIAPWGIPVALVQPWGELSSSVWAALFYAAAVSMLIGYSLWNWAIMRGGVARTVPYLFLVPVVTAVLSAVILGEFFTPLKLAGAAMVLAGTTSVRLLGRRTTTPPLEPDATPIASPATARAVGS